MKNATRNELPSQQRTLSKPWGFILINAVLFIALSTLAFYHNLPYLFYAEDGHYMMNLAREDNLWRGFDFGLTSNFLQSIWGIWFPMNTKFFPGYFIATMFGDNIYLSHIIAYDIFSFEFFIIGFMVARTVGLGWNLALIAAWVLPFLAYPYYYYPVLYNITSLAPQVGTIIVATSLIIILFVNLGRQGQTFLGSLFSSAGITLLSLFIVFTIPVDVILSAPIIIVFCTAYLLSCGSKSEQKTKIIFSSGTLICLLATGAPLYIYGLTKFSVSYYLPTDLRNGVQTIDWSAISILFHGKGLGESWVFILAFLGSIFYSFNKDNFKKSIARALLATIFVLIGLGALLVKFNIWSGPVPIYYEFCLWPLYVAYSVAFIGIVVVFIIQKLIPKWEMNLNTYFLRSLIIIAPWSIFLLSRPIGDIWDIPNPPIKTTIVETLAHKIALTPGKEFQGRVINITGQNIKEPLSRGTQAANDNLILRKTGNDHRMNGLWFYNIPTLDTCSQLISPTYFQFARTFFSSPSDLQERGSITLRQSNPRWLAALGVRFVITDAPMTEMLQRKIMPLAELGNLYLYEFSQTNIGQYSPTHVVKMVNSKKILERLQKRQFDPKTQIITDAELPKKLVKARNSKLIVNKGSFNISATSKGDSVILLPVEYSHCLSIKSNTQVQPILFRANMALTGIFFHHQLDASIRYFTGPFQNSTCRLKDAKDFEKGSSLLA